MNLLDWMNLFQVQILFWRSAELPCPRWSQIHHSTTSRFVKRQIIYFHLTFLVTLCYVNLKWHCTRPLTCTEIVSFKLIEIPVAKEILFIEINGLKDRNKLIFMAEVINEGVASLNRQRFYNRLAPSLITLGFIITHQTVQHVSYFDMVTFWSL